MYLITIGFQLGIALASVPPMLLAPATIAVRQWSVMFSRGKAVVPPMALLSSSAFAYLAYNIPATSRLYASAALSSFAIIPYTLLVLSPTNSKLLKRAAEAEKLSTKDELDETRLPRGESSKELIDKWNSLHVGRLMLPLISTLLGVWATLF